MQDNRFIQTRSPESRKPGWPGCRPCEEAAARLLRVAAYPYEAWPSDSDCDGGAAVFFSYGFLKVFLRNFLRFS